MKTKTRSGVADGLGWPSVCALDGFGWHLIASPPFLSPGEDLREGEESQGQDGVDARPGAPAPTTHQGGHRATVRSVPARLASRGSGLLSLRSTRRLGGERSRLLLRARPYITKRRERAYRACACHGTGRAAQRRRAALRWREPAPGRCRGAPSTCATCHRHVSCAFRRLIMRGISGSLRNSAAEGMGERRRWGRVPYFVVCAYGVGLACNAR